MPTPMTKELTKLRKVKKLTQAEVAKMLGIPRATYAKKESEGDFSIEDIPQLHKILGGEKERLSELVRQSDRINIDNWKEYLIKNTIDSRAILRVLLGAMSELLADQRGESVTKVLNELTMAVEGEKSMNSIR